MKVTPGITICAAALLSSTSAFTMHTKLNPTNSPSTSLNNSRRSFLEKAATTTASTFLISTQSASAEETSETASVIQVGGKSQFGTESIMSPKEHGTSSQPVQESLRFNVNRKTADKICSYNRHMAEYATYFQEQDEFLSILKESSIQNNAPITFYDSVTGKALFQAPIGRTTQQFYEESQKHGWPSFRDEEVVWDNVRILKNSGETVSVDGTHLGHNLPDRNGNRYCINLVSNSGNPV